MIPFFSTLWDIVRGKRRNSLIADKRYKYKCIKHKWYTVRRLHCTDLTLYGGYTVRMLHCAESTLYEGYTVRWEKDKRAKKTAAQYL